MNNYLENENQALNAANASRIRAQLRNNENVNGKNVKSTKRASNKILLTLTILSFAAISITLLGYSQSKSKLQGVVIDPRTGFTSTTQNNIEPSFEEVIEDMFKGKGK